MECPVCLDGYHSKQPGRLPKFLPCGHSACVGCLGRVQNCPKCRKCNSPPRCSAHRREFAVSADALPTNFDLIHDHESADGPSRWWCSECTAPATAECVHSHTLIRLQAALRRQAQAVAPLAAEAVCGLEDAVQAAAAEPARCALGLLAGPAASCRLSVDQDGKAVGAQWRMEEGGAGGAVDWLARALVCQLAVAGLLKQEQQLTPETPRAAAVAADVIPVLDVGALCRSEREEDKEAQLERVQRNGVRRLSSVYVPPSDRGWCLQLLLAAAASVEELQLRFARADHLLAVLAMPGLRRLDLFCDADALNREPPVQLAAPSRLQWLRLYGLPRATTRSLLRAHADSLRTLTLWVGMPGVQAWPTCCDDLGALLAGCGLARLERLVLCRVSGVAHPAARCRAQLEEVRVSLPAATVLCDVCDPVDDVEF